MAVLTITIKSCLLYTSAAKPVVVDPVIETPVHHHTDACYEEVPPGHNRGSLLLQARPLPGRTPAHRWWCSKMCIRDRIVCLAMVVLAFVIEPERMYSGTYKIDKELEQYLSLIHI